MAPASDVTGDGRADLVVQRSSADAGALRIFADNGSPSANPWPSSTSTTSQRWDFADLVVAADVTGDGKADILARDPAAAGGTLWIYPNSGSSADPWTEQRIQAGTGWNLARTILMGDVNADRHPDLIVRQPTVSNGVLLIYPGNGSVTGNPWTAAPIGAGTGWDTVGPIALADVTLDGFPDVIALTGSGALNVYVHNKATTGNPFTTISLGANGWGAPTQFAFAEVTGDGKPDLLLRDDADRLWIHPFRSATPGELWSPTVRYAAGSGFGFAREVLPADIDGDGRAELLARISAGGILQTWVNNRSATGNPWPTAEAAGTDWGFASRIYLGDATKDRRQDLIVLEGSAANGTLWIYPNTVTGTGRSRWGARYFAGNGWNIFTMLTVGDVTGDGLVDVIGRDSAGSLWVYPGNGSVAAFPWQQRFWAGTGWNAARQLAVADLDRDGIGDLLSLDTDGSLTLYPSAGKDPIAVPGQWQDVEHLGLGPVTAARTHDLVVQRSSGAVSIYPDNGSTTGNPWTGSPRFGGTGYQHLQSFAL